MVLSWQVGKERRAYHTLEPLLRWSDGLLDLLKRLAAVLDGLDNLVVGLLLVPDLSHLSQFIVVACD